MDMPPEQLTGIVDETSDLFALGATLIHLLTARPPEELAGEKLEVSAEFDRFVRKLAAEKPERRFASAAEALRAFDALPPIAGMRQSRRPLWIALGGALAIAGAVAITGVIERAPVERAMPPPAPAPLRFYARQPSVVRYEAPSSSAALSREAAIRMGTEL